MKANLLKGEVFGGRGDVKAQIDHGNGGITVSMLRTVRLSTLRSEGHRAWD